MTQLPPTIAPPKPVEELREKSDRFRCEPYSVTMLAKGCVERQAAVRERVKANLIIIDFYKCNGCALGKRVEAAVGKAEADPHQKNHGGWQSVRLTTSKPKEPPQFFGGEIPNCAHVGCPRKRVPTPSTVPGGDGLCHSHRIILAKKLKKEAAAKPLVLDMGPGAPTGETVVVPFQGAQGVFVQNLPKRPPHRRFELLEGGREEPEEATIPTLGDSLKPRPPAVAAGEKYVIPGTGLTLAFEPGSVGGPVASPKAVPPKKRHVQTKKENPMPYCTQKGCDTRLRRNSLRKPPPKGTETLCQLHRDEWVATHRTQNPTHPHPLKPREEIRAHKVRRSRVWHENQKKLADAGKAALGAAPDLQSLMANARRLRTAEAAVLELVAPFATAEKVQILVSAIAQIEETTP